VIVEVVGWLARVGEGDVVEGHHGRREARAVGESEGERLLAQGRAFHRLGLDLLQHLTNKQRSV